MMNYCYVLMLDRNEKSVSEHLIDASPVNPL